MFSIGSYLRVIKSWDCVGLELTHYHTMPHFEALKIYSCGRHCEKKEKLLVTSNFSFSHIVFYPIWHIIHFECTLKCRLQFVSIWTSLKFCCVGKELNLMCYKFCPYELEKYGSMLRDRFLFLYFTLDLPLPVFFFRCLNEQFFKMFFPCMTCTISTTESRLKIAKDMSILIAD